MVLEAWTALKAAGDGPKDHSLTFNAWRSIRRKVCALAHERSGVIASG
jgi:hypothetical protein